MGGTGQSGSDYAAVTCNNANYNPAIITITITITTNTSDKPFQNFNGLRSINGTRFLLKNSLFGCRKSYTYSDNSSYRLVGSGCKAFFSTKSIYAGISRFSSSTLSYISLVCAALLRAFATCAPYGSRPVSI